MLGDRRRLAAATALVALSATPATADREMFSPADGHGTGQTADSEPGATPAELRAQAKANDLSP